MDLLDQAKGASLSLVDVRNEQDRVAEEKIEAERSICSLPFSALLICSELTASSQLSCYAGFFQATHPINTRTSV